MVIRESSPAPRAASPDPRPVDVSRPGQAPGSSGGAAGALAPLLRALLGTELPVRFEFWDGSGIGPVGGPGTIRVNSVDAVRRMLWAPGELGVARAFVAGDLSLEGDLFAMLRVLHDAAPRDLRKMGLRALPPIIDAARRLGAIGPPLPAPAEECRPTGRIHSLGRDAKVISHHYDVGNEFYRLFLGPRMTYSCARFVSDTSTLEEAQDAKHELICRKLGLDQHPGARLLDVGCGWGSMAIHAAQHHQASVVGVALSTEQVELARERVKAAGLDDRIEIRLQDYRELKGEQFDAISSIGMFEHVGTSAMGRYFATLRNLLGPTGRLLNHAISTPGGSVLGRRTFIGRYVFPDGELLDVGQVILAMQQAGFEVRDVESLREHYAKTLRAWVANLEGQWDEAVGLVGEHRADIWRFYMAASANGFDDAGLAIHQVLGVISEPKGDSGMPPTRTGWS
ncbi:MAG TPA: cyclopropane-fatty-acyl-phospholipid synthase family protein [Acidimicrobiales bacterium]|nr:cyclopropane-fatty-acyl-phospholipid synthase family protein [Acidimicrobiales bacterium]